MEEEIFTADAKSRTVKALGVEIDAKLEELRILVNGVDILKTIKLSSLRIVKEEKS